MARPKRTPTARTLSISANANSGLVRYARSSSRTRARSRPVASLVQLSVRNRRKPTITGPSRDARVIDTKIWQFAFLPSAEIYCGATPTEWSPFLGKVVSSMISQALSLPTSRLASAGSVTSSGTSSQALLLT